ncbi:B- and T-lymphocyte attenuator, partial [Galemys pyrenaicus]
QNSCIELRIKRDTHYTIQAGNSFDLECPVKYCADRPNVTWCKLEEGKCLSIEDKIQGHMSWKNRDNISVFVLHFNQVNASHNGSYRCSATIKTHQHPSHTITLYVKDTTSASETSLKGKKMDTRWILYSVVPLGGLPLLITCIYLFCCLRRHKGEQKKSSDAAQREINLVDVPQSFRGEQTEVGTRQNSQALPSEVGIYDNEPWPRIQDVSGIYSNPRIEENRQGIVYASLNHLVTGMNPRQSRHMEEAQTEYAAI